MLTRFMAVVVLVLAFSGVARAEEMKADAAVVAAVVPVDVGNKICPISGEETGKMGPAKVVEYKGKKYNLCCAMCEKDFFKDPEAAVKKIEDSLAAEGDEDEGTEATENAQEDAAEGHEPAGGM